MTHLLQLGELVRRRAGIVLGADKAYLIESRLAPLARRHGFADTAALAAAIEQAPAEPLLRAITEALTTNETSFFRDRRPFAQLAGLVLPRLLEARKAVRRLRLWSAAAATGQEAYSLAMCLDDLAGAVRGWQVAIVATDLSRAALERAASGRYSAFEVQRGLPPARLARHFKQDGEAWVIDERLRAMVDFRPLNLLDGCREVGGCDVVFLRNVLIYFDLATRRRVLEDVASLLPADGYLFLGGTETVLGVTDAFEPIAECPGCFRPTGGRKARPADAAPHCAPAIAGMQAVPSA